MYMRYLGGGVGHRGEGVDVSTSRMHAKRAPRIQRRRREESSGTRLTGIRIVEHSDERSGSGEEPGTAQPIQEDPWEDVSHNPGK